MFEWKPLTEPPNKSGYVLLAALHHRTIPTVLYGFCKLQAEGVARFTEDIYHGQGIAITHWMPLPKHPMEVQDEREEEVNLLSTA